jgi:hypothetical protein
MSSKSREITSAPVLLRPFADGMERPLPLPRKAEKTVIW